MSTKEQFYVVIKDEETRKKALQVLIKHDQNSENFEDFKEFPFLKFVSNENIWLTSDFTDYGTTELSVERLDEILSQSKSEKENGWYKHTNGQYKNWLVYYDFKNNVRYGFNVNGYWFQDNGTDYKASLELATEKEVSSALIEEAINRGFKKGLPIISPDGIDYGFDIKDEVLLFSFETNTLFVKEDGVNLFHDGNWAKIKEVNHEPSTEQIVKKVKFSEFPKSPRIVEKSILQEEVFNPQPHYDNSKGSLYKIGTERNWNPYLFDVVKRLERGGKKDPLKQEIEKSIDVLKIWLNEL